MYWDLLTKIKNAEAAGKNGLRVPFSLLDLSVAEALAKNGYIKDAKKKLLGKKKFRCFLKLKGDTELILD